MHFVFALPEPAARFLTTLLCTLVSDISNNEGQISLIRDFTEGSSMLSFSDPSLFFKKQQH